MKTKFFEVFYEALKKYGFEILTAIGFTFVTYVGIDTAFDTILSELSSSTNRIDSATLQLFFIAGGGEALNIIASAYSAKIAFDTAAKIRFKPSN